MCCSFLILRLPQLFVILPSVSRSPLSSAESSAVHTSLFNFPFSTVSHTIELCSVGAETFTLFSFNPSACSSSFFSGLTELCHGNWAFLQPWALLARWTFRKYNLLNTLFTLTSYLSTNNVQQWTYIHPRRILSLLYFFSPEDIRKIPINTQLNHFNYKSELELKWHTIKIFFSSEFPSHSISNYSLRLLSLTGILAFA